MPAHPKAVAPVPAPDARLAPWRDRVFLGWLLIILLLGTFFMVRHALVLAKPFADTHTYLEIGRNLFEGRGFITRYNVVYGWSGTPTHPGLAYYNPIYCLLIAIPWQLSKSTAVLAIWATVIPALANTVLLAWLVRRSLGNFLALLCAVGYLLLPSTYTNITLISAEHPMVTLELILLLLVQLLAPRGDRAWFWIGLALAVGYLIKVSILIAAPALLLGLLLTRAGGPSARLRQAVRPTLLFVVGFGAILVPFNLVAKATTGKWYPEYPLLARNWSMATLYGGELVPESPAVRPDPEALPNVVDCADLVIDNLGAMSRALTGELGFLLLFVALGFSTAVWLRWHDAVFLFCLGAAFLVAYPVTYYWLSLTREAGSAARYALHVAPFWYPLGVAGIAAVLARTGLHPLLRQIAVFAVWGVLAFPSTYALLRRQATLPARNTVTAALEQSMAACRQLTQPDDLVAIAGAAPWVFGSMYLDRPVITLPQVQLDTPENAARLLRIYSPKLVIPGNARGIHAVIEAMGYRLASVPSVSPDRNVDVVYVRE